MKHTLITSAATLAVALSCATNAGAQTNVGQWDFDQGNLNQTAGADLGPITFTGPMVSNLTHFGTTGSFGIPDIAGSSASVIKFPGSIVTPPDGFLMPTPPGNGGGSLVNQYTIIYDVLWPNNNQFHPLLQMDDGTLDGIKAVLAVNAAGQITVTNTIGAGLPSGSFGLLSANTWYRIGFTVDETIGEINVFTNGVQVGALEVGSDLDGPYSLYAGDLPVFCSTITNADGYANSVQLRDTILNPGEMEALGGPVASGIPVTLPPAHSYIASRSPSFGQVDVGPTPAISVDLNQGDSVVDSGSIALTLDGNIITTAVVSGGNNDYVITHSDTNILAPLSTHTLTLSYNDSVSGARVKTWQFRVANYQVVNLPPPIYFEDFEEVNSPNDTSITPVAQVTFMGYQIEPGAPSTPLPTGWAVSNVTVVQDDLYDLTDPNSDYFLNWAVLDTNYVASFDDQTGSNSSPGLGFAIGINGRLQYPPILLNGSLVTNMFSGNMIYCDSDHRQNGGGQVNVVFTGDYDLTGYSNVYCAFHNCYEQNQDNIGSVEYSIDQGKTWLPALYLLDDGSTDGDGSDIVTNNGVIDVFATFGTARSDQAYNLAYSNFIGAVVSTNLAPFLQGRRNDDPVSSKRIEVLRLVGADNQPHVRFRFGQAGTSSWFFGFDDFGIYSIETPVISSSPVSQSVNAGLPVTFSVVASGAQTYQWQFNSVNIPGATNTSYSIASAQPTNAGLYSVIVSNPSGPVTSAPAQLTVNTLATITTQPSGEIVDLNGSVTFVSAATGGVPLTYSWYQNGALVQSSTSPNLTISPAPYSAAGNYEVVVSNSYNAVTSAVAILKVWAGPISSNLVVHLPFDGDLNDTSGRGNNATYLYNGQNSSTTPRFSQGVIGSQAFEYTTTSDFLTQEYASLGYPPDLQLGDSQDFSVSFWCQYTNQGDDLPFISNKDWNSSSDVGWGIFTQSGGNYRINVTGPNLGQDKFSETDTPTILKDGHWHNIVVSLQRAPFGESAFVYGYVDGHLATKHPMGVVGSIDTLSLPFQNEQGVSPVQSGWAVNIGQDGTGTYADGGSAHDINALIDDLGFWRRALTANEASGIYQAGLIGRDLTMAATATLTVVKSGSNVVLMWLGSADVAVEKATSLTAKDWTIVPGTQGASSVTLPASAGDGYFRLVIVQ
jgi:hypothetical protein